MPRWLLATLLLLVAALCWLARYDPASQATGGGGGSGVPIDACLLLRVPTTLDDAEQSAQVAPPFRVGQATLTPLAGFSVAGRVLSRADYHFGREADFSPTDLALGWGPMSAPGLAEQLDVSQGNRWYRYRWGAAPPLPPALIASHSANMHMIPADAGVARDLARISAGDRVRLDGWLLRIDADDGWHWQSSMSRDDVGAGACELVLVCAVSAQ